MLKVQYKIFILLFIPLSGCMSVDEHKKPDHIKDLKNLTVYSWGKNPTYKIQLKQEIRFGSAMNVLVGGPSGNVAQVDEKGRVFIPDRKQNTIHVFQPNARYMAQIGKKGRGPGEFLSLGIVKIDSNNLYVYDSLQMKIIVFSLDSLALSHTVNLDPQNWRYIDGLNIKNPSHYFVKDNEAFLVKFTPSILEIENMQDKNYTHSYYYINRQGEIISDKIINQRGSQYVITTFRGVRFSVTLPFRGEPLILLSSNNYIFSAWTEDFLIKVYNSDGDYVRSFYYPYKRSTLSRVDLIENYNHGFDHPILNVIRSIELPQTWPALHSMSVDDQNRLWVSTIVNNRMVYQWWVLDEYGKLLARFRWPRNKPIEVVKNGYLYTKEEDEETGAASVVRYRIVMKPQAAQ